MGWKFNLDTIVFREGDICFRKEIICADGFRMSVQASRMHYCTPRTNECDNYTHVEIGFPSERVPEIMEYCEDKENPTRAVYGWVPVEIVEKIVEDHGGIAS